MGRRRATNKVSLVCPADRPILLKFWCPIEKRRVRRSTGTYDTRDANRQRKLLEAQLLTGTYERPVETTWIEFRERYDREELKANLSKQGRRAANGALDMYERIIRPELLAEAITAESIVRFRNGFASGKFSRFSQPRSPHTVASRMSTVLAAFRWAEPMYGIVVPRVPRYRPGTKKKAMKGRPITLEEFERLLEKVPLVTGPKAAPSWRHLLVGLWESGLRIDEAMTCSWDQPFTVRPIWRRGALPTVLFPGETQKNGDDDEIPMLPGFESLLSKTPAELRTGWVFDPESLQTKLGRTVRRERCSSEWASKVIVRIGKAAGIIVEPAKGKKKVKFASAHDLRRSCADRLEAAGVDPMVIARIMRHKSYETTRRHYAAGNVQRDADSVRRAVAKDAVSGHSIGHIAEIV